MAGKHGQHKEFDGPEAEAAARTQLPGCADPLHWWVWGRGLRAQERRGKGGEARWPLGCLSLTCPRNAVGKGPGVLAVRTHVLAVSVPRGHKAAAPLWLYRVCGAASEQAGASWTRPLGAQSPAPCPHGPHLPGGQSSCPSAAPGTLRPFLLHHLSTPTPEEPSSPVSVAPRKCVAP